MPVTTKLVQSLAHLPLELALEIINDLRVWDVIKLMLRNNSTINGFLLAHERCKKLLGEDGEALTRNREQFQAYLHFARERNLELGLPHDTFYEYSLFDCRMFKGQHDSWRIADPIHRNVWFVIPTWEEELLTPYVQNPDGFPSISSHSSLEEFKKWWHVMAEAKGVLSRRCAHQLQRGAELLEENPDILKCTTDPEQVVRSNTQHNVARMQQTAHKILHRNAWDFRRIVYFKYEFYPIIPFDDTLAELLRMMEKHRVSSGKEVLLNDPQSPAIKDLVRVVVDGMPYFYPLEPRRPVEVPTYYVTNTAGDILRTENTPWSDERKEKDKPEDLVMPWFTPALFGIEPGFRRVRAFHGQEPHAEKEERWLEAFVKLYRYLEKLEQS